MDINQGRWQGIKGDIPKDRDGRSKGTKVKKSIFGERVRHPLAGPRGLEAEGKGGFCREEIRLLGRGLSPRVKQPRPCPAALDYFRERSHIEF